MTFANTATSTNGTRIANGNSGRARPRRKQRGLPPAPPGSGGPTTTARVCSPTTAMAYLFAQPDARIDVGIKDIDRQVDQHDHDAGFHDDPLHERKIALEDTLVEQPSDPRPGENDLNDHRCIDHHDEVDPGQSQYRDQRVFEGVHRDDDVAR